MTYKTTLEIKNGYILCTCQGNLDNTALLTLANDSLKNRARHNLDGLLADMRETTTDMSMLDAVQFGEILSELISPSSRARTAIVHSEQDKAVCRLFETALVNRSFTVRLFRDLETAEAWLTHMNERDRASRR